MKKSCSVQIEQLFLWDMDFPKSMILSIQSSMS